MKCDVSTMSSDSAMTRSQRLHRDLPRKMIAIDALSLTTWRFSGAV
jgi:hypothetical protein